MFGNISQNYMIMLLKTMDPDHKNFDGSVLPKPEFYNWYKKFQKRKSVGLISL